MQTHDPSESCLLYGIPSGTASLWEGQSRREVWNPLLKPVVKPPGVTWQRSVFESAALQFIAVRRWKRKIKNAVRRAAVMSLPDRMRTGLGKGKEMSVIGGTPESAGGTL